MEPFASTLHSAQASLIIEMGTDLMKKVFRKELYIRYLIHVLRPHSFAAKSRLDGMLDRVFDSLVSVYMQDVL